MTEEFVSPLLPPSRIGPYFDKIVAKPPTNGAPILILSKTFIDGDVFGKIVSISSFEELSGGKLGSASNLIGKLKELSDSKPRQPSIKQMNFVKNLANKVDLDEESACKLVAISAYSELSGGRGGTASKLIAILQKKAPKKK